MKSLSGKNIFPSIFSVILFVFLLSGIAYADKIKVNDAKELLDLVLTEKDYSLAVDLIERADNTTILKNDQDIRQEVTRLASLYYKPTPKWAFDGTLHDDESIAYVDNLKDETYGGGSSYGLNTGEREIVQENKTTRIDNYLARKDVHKPYSLLGFMLASFLAGLLALLTPCVFPMIPMTVTFFTSDNKGQRKKAVFTSVFFGLSIVFIYSLTGMILAPLTGPDTANYLSTHWLPNIILFSVLVIFAFSFLGMFEITLPNWLINKADKQSDKGGLYGAFFMALTLVLVSFSCTGPIVGFILIEAASGEFIKPILGMFAFSMSFALPFTLFAIFPEWLNSLPKSGGWLNSVKVVLGFLELALALKFLSVADQVYHWGILDREVYIAIWIVIFALMGFYLLGKIRLPNDSEVIHLSVTRMIFAIVSFTFVVYLIPGMWGAPLKKFAGYLPPLTTHDFELREIIRQNAIANIGDKVQNVCDNEKIKYSEFLHLPHGLRGYFDYEQGLKCAKALKKPVFIDFTGHGCVNCREMEYNVWSHPEVLKRLREDYVIISLYVDEKKTLADSSEWYRSEFDGKLKKTIGKKNFYIQMDRFNSNAQPFYVLLDGKDEKLLNKPKAYDSNIQNFIKFLDEGKEIFNKKHRYSSL